MRLRTLFLLFPWLWLFGAGLTQLTGHPWTTSNGTVRRAGNAIVRFQKEQNRLPETLTELRAYGYAQGDKPDIYDNYGHRLSYHPLTENSFFVKSFGRDGTENTILISKDESFSHNVLIPPRGVKISLSKESRLNFFQAASLDGAQAPKGSLFASLHSRFRGGVKRLLIQNLKEKQFFMLSVHDAVEEFLWLPSGSELIFSAQGSNRYEDGLYYWNLQTNLVRNLMPEFRKKNFPQLTESHKLLFSLSHVSAKPDFIYLFAQPMPSDGSLDPKDFYRYQNFYALNPKADFISEKVIAERDFNIFDYGADPHALVEADEGTLALPAQKAWLDLTLSGDKQTLLESWQNYASTFATSASLPYALWWLASIYNDTYRELMRAQPDNARTIRNFALEIADALSQLPSGPLYIRGFAEHLKKDLLLSKPANYNVTPMSVESDVRLNPKVLEGEKKDLLQKEKDSEKKEIPAKSPEAKTEEAKPQDEPSPEKDKKATQDKSAPDADVVEPGSTDPR